MTLHLASGDVFGGAFRIEAELGSGGFSRVYRAVHPRYGEVALKLLLPDHGNSYQAATNVRFAREVEILSQLRSPHTVRFIASGKADGVFFLVTELVGDQDLGQLLQQRGTLSSEETRDILNQLLGALAEAHSAGLVHRDIKPQNIRVSRLQNGRLHATLLDFGIARHFVDARGQVTRTGEIIGTPRYMSPEQLRALPIGPASDLYSLGMVAFEVLCGSASLSSNALGAQIPRMVEGLRFQTAIASGVEPKLLDVVLRLIQPDPVDRFPSAQAARRALGASVKAPQSAPASAKPANGLPLGPAAILVGMGVLTLALYTWSQNSSPKPTGSPRRLPQPAQAPPPPPPIDTSHGTGADAADADADADADAVRVCAERAPFSGFGDLAGETAYVPTECESPQQPCPLLVALHMDAESPRQLLIEGGFVELAEERHVILFAPQDSFTNAWREEGPDLRRIEDRVAEARSIVCTDPARTWVVGNSDGARLLADLSCKPWVQAVVFNSFVPHSLGRPFECPDRPVPAMHIFPTQSRFITIDGSPSCSGRVRPSHDAVMKVWLQRNGCGEPAPTKRQTHGECQSWQCSDARVARCLVDGGEGWSGRQSSRMNIDCRRESPATRFPSARAVFDFLGTVQSGSSDPMR